MNDKYLQKARAVCPWHHLAPDCTHCENIAEALREAAAQAFGAAAARCQTRATDAKLAKMPAVLVEELKSRRDYFLARAAHLRNRRTP